MLSKGSSHLSVWTVQLPISQSSVGSCCSFFCFVFLRFPSWPSLLFGRAFPFPSPPMMHASRASLTKTGYQFPFHIYTEKEAIAHAKTCPGSLFVQPPCPFASCPTLSLFPSSPFQCCSGWLVGWGPRSFSLTPSWIWSFRPIIRPFSFTKRLPRAVNAFFSSRSGKGENKHSRYCPLSVCVMCCGCGCGCWGRRIGCPFVAAT